MPKWDYLLDDSVDSLFENTERTLFHGTWIGNVPSIREVGLVGDVGEFVQEMYGSELAELQRFSMSGEEDADSLVFFGDKRTMDSCVGAMRYHISKKVSGFKWLSDVTLKDIERHGALVIVKEIDVPKPKDDTYTKDSGFHQRPSDDDDMNWYADYPMSVEPGDYYAYGDSAWGADIILTGKKMISFLRRHGALQNFMKVKRSRLISFYKKQGIQTRDAIKRVRSMSDDEVLQVRRGMGMNNG